MKRNYIQPNTIVSSVVLDAMVLAGSPTIITNGGNASQLGTPIVAD